MDVLAARQEESVRCQRRMGWRGLRLTDGLRHRCCVWAWLMRVSTGHRSLGGVSLPDFYPQADVTLGLWKCETLMHSGNKQQSLVLQPPDTSYKERGNKQINQTMNLLTINKMYHVIFMCRRWELNEAVFIFRPQVIVFLNQDKFNRLPADSKN